ncbi:MAG TPA: 30S ribosomal protein S20 [Chloroflexota bacterium]|nr:30S ribosomal protein S20 [Chloroflexota bacterium]
MANTKSALKRIQTSEKRHQRNQAVKSATRTFVKKARTAIAQDAAGSREQVVAAIAALDVAVRKGVIHRNNAARRKSRLMKRFNAAQPSATPVAPAAAEEPAAPAAPEAKPRRRRTTK